MIGTTTIAAPAYGAAYGGAYGASYAAPTTYAAPATTAYAAPATTAYAAPTTYAAPATTAYAAPAMTAVPSYVAPPVAAVAAPVAPQLAAPAPPPSLTAGIPTPEQIATQKAQFAKQLDEQLKTAIATVQKETQIEKDMVKFNAEKQIALYNLQVDEKLTEMMALAEEQGVISTCELNKARVERGLQLNTQAQGLVFDYNMRATQQELAQRQAAFSKQYLTEENKLAQDFAAQMGKAGPANLSAGGVYGGVAAAPVTYAAPATTVAAAPVTYAAPATTVAAAPVTYAAPTTYAAAAPVTYAAPATTVAAAPVTYAAPTTYAAAAPVTYAAGATTVAGVL